MNSRGVAISFAIAAAGFLFPFFDISCQGKKVARLTGLQLVTGASQDDIAIKAKGERATQKMSGGKRSNPDPLAIAALVMPVVGLIICLVSRRRVFERSATVAAVGAGLLLWLSAWVDAGWLMRQFGSDDPDAVSVVAIKCAWGLWLSGLAMAAALLFSLNSMRARQPRPIRCAGCGETVNAAAKFCPKCGKGGGADIVPPNGAQSVQQSPCASEPSDARPRA